VKFRLFHNKSTTLFSAVDPLLVLAEHHAMASLAEEGD